MKKRTTIFLQAEGTPVPLDGADVRVGPWKITTVEAETKAPEVSRDQPHHLACIWTVLF